MQGEEELFEKKLSKEEKKKIQDDKKAARQAEKAAKDAEKGKPAKTEKAAKPAGKAGAAKGEKRAAPRARDARRLRFVVKTPTLLTRVTQSLRRQEGRRAREGAERPGEDRRRGALYIALHCIALHHIALH